MVGRLAGRTVGQTVKRGSSLHDGRCWCWFCGEPQFEPPLIRRHLILDQMDWVILKRAYSVLLLPFLKPVARGSQDPNGLGS